MSSTVDNEVFWKVTDENVGTPELKTVAAARLLSLGTTIKRPSPYPGPLPPHTHNCVAVLFVLSGEKPVNLQVNERLVGI